MTVHDPTSTDPTSTDPTSTDPSLTEFARAVHGVVTSLPRGTCASYGEVAAEAGRPGAARGVGRVLAGSSGLPWWRVVRADGTLPKGADQARRLEEEGVSIIGGRVRPTGRGSA